MQDITGGRDLMAYYKTCPECGSALDPGEICDCKEKAVLDAANIRDGKAEQARHKLNYSAPIIQNYKGECQG